MLRVALAPFTRLANARPPGESWGWCYPDELML
jgi:hypothetical protein